MNALQLVAGFDVCTERDNIKNQQAILIGISFFVVVNFIAILLVRRINKSKLDKFPKSIIQLAIIAAALPVSTLGGYGLVFILSPWCA